MATTETNRAKRILTIADLIRHNPTLSILATKNSQRQQGDDRAMEVWASLGFVSYAGSWDIRDGEHGSYDGA